MTDSPANRGDRGQTLPDFAVGVAIFLITITFILVFVPQLALPFEDQEQPVVAERIASDLSNDLLAEPGTASMLNESCTLAFFDRSAGNGCPFDDEPLGEQLGVGSQYAVNIAVWNWSVAFEMLGPPRLSKLLFEGALLERLYDDLEAAAALDPDDAAARAGREIREDRRLRSDILSIGLPVLLADGDRLLRGPEMKVAPGPGEDLDVDRCAERGWVDLRPVAWQRWAERCRGYLQEQVRAPGPEEGSATDLDVRGRTGEIRPGVLAAWVFRVEDQGERAKR